MIRRVLKNALATGLHASGTHRLLGRVSGRSRSPLLLCYHRVVENLDDHPESAPAMLTSVDTFERQIDWIGRHYDFVSLDEAVDGAEQGRHGGRPRACITFDDGYADVFHNAIPLLLRKGIPAACFVVTGLLDGATVRLQHDELICALRSALCATNELRARDLLERHGVPAAMLRQRPLGRLRPVELCEALLVEWPSEQVAALIEGLRQEAGGDAGSDQPCHRSSSMTWSSMTWSMLRELSAAGFEIGSHTRTHRILPLATEDVMRDELVHSKRCLEQELGRPIRHLAYPNGRFDERTVRAAAHAGYEHAYTTCVHRHPARPSLTIPRQCLWERSAYGAFGSFSESVAACHVHGVFELVHSCRDDHGSRPVGTRPVLQREPPRPHASLDLFPWTAQALEATRAGSFPAARQPGMTVTGDPSDG